MNAFGMVVLIVATVSIAGILRARYGVIRDHKGRESFRPADNGENERLREQLHTLKERVAVLERIATENDRGLSLDREIEALRDKN